MKIELNEIEKLILFCAFEKAVIHKYETKEITLVSIDYYETYGFVFLKGDLIKIYNNLLKKRFIYEKKEGGWLNYYLTPLGKNVAKLLNKDDVISYAKAEEREIQKDLRKKPLTENQLNMLKIMYKYYKLFENQDIDLSTSGLIALYRKEYNKNITSASLDGLKRKGLILLKRKGNWKYWKISKIGIATLLKLKYRVSVKELKDFEKIYYEKIKGYKKPSESESFKEIYEEKKEKHNILKEIKELLTFLEKMKIKKDLPEILLETSKIYNLMPKKKPRDKKQLEKDFPNQINYIFGLFNIAKKLKNRLKAKALTYEQLKTHFGYISNPIISTIKYDGEFNIAVFDFDKLGDNVLIINDYNRIRYHFIISKRLNDLLRDYTIVSNEGKKEIKQAILVGELFAINLKSGDHLSREEVMSIIKKTETKQREYQIRFAVFDIFQINFKDLIKNNSYKDRTLLIQDIIKTPNDFIIPVYAKYGNFSVIKDMWEKHILTSVPNMLREGLMIHTNGYIKVKPYNNIDCVILGYDVGGKLIAKEMVSSILMGLMNKKGELQTIGKMSFGRDVRSKKPSVSNQMKNEWFKKLNKIKLDQFLNFKNSKIQMVKPQHIFEVSYERALIRPAKEEKQLVLEYRSDKKKYLIKPSKASISLLMMKFVEIRKDKTVNIKDLRLEQIPEYSSHLESLKS